jgi:hypothetical protein
MKKKPNSVATILDREIGPTIEEWLRRVNLLSELTAIPLSDDARSAHLPKLYHALTCRLRLAKDIRPLASIAATAHGQWRRLQGYSPAMLVEESRLFEVVTFQTLNLHQDELDQEQVLSAVITIADEADFQLGQAVRCWQTPLSSGHRLKFTPHQIFVIKVRSSTNCLLTSGDQGNLKPVSNSQLSKSSTMGKARA